MSESILKSSQNDSILLQKELDRLLMLREVDAATSRCRASFEEEHARVQVVAAVRGMAVATTAALGLCSTIEGVSARGGRADGGFARGGVGRGR